MKNKRLYIIFCSILAIGVIITMNYNIQMQQRNSDDSGWDNNYPITKSENVLMKDGKTIDSHLSDIAINVKNFGAVGDGLTDDTQAFNAAMHQALNSNASFVATENKTYLIEGDITYHDEVIVCVGRGEVVTTNPNNRYFKIYDPRELSGTLPLINPGYRFENISKFAKAIVTAKAGGAKVKITFVGDSLTQAGHRASDNYYWVKQLQDKLIEQFGDYFIFYNRGVAGTAIASLNNVLSTSINAPFETDWVTESGVKTWLQYIDDTDPDLIISAFGTNAMTGNTYKDLSDGRVRLKSVSSNPDIIWVTSPIRTINTEAIYNDNEFGTYPNNEYSNTAGITTRLFAQKHGDAVIDVNRNASVVLLGFDPYQYRIDEWFGQYRTTDNAFSGSTSMITVGDTGIVAIDASGGQKITSKRLFRNFSMEFTPSITGTMTNLRIECRKDPNSTSEIVFIISNSGITYYGVSLTSGVFGGLKSWTGDCRGKTVRIEVIGTQVRVYVDGSGWVIDSKEAIATQFLAPLTIHAQSADCILEDVRINSDEYKKYIPRTTSNEVYNIFYGDGGNGLNHLNTNGELELFGQPLNEFVSSLSNIEYLTKIDNVNLSGSVPLPTGVTGTLDYVKRNNIVTLHFNDLSGTFGNSAILVTLPSDLRPLVAVRGVISRTGAGTQETMTIDARSNGSVYVYSAPMAGVKYSGSIVFITN